MLSADLLTASLGPKWYDKVKVNDAYKFGMYERIWCQSLQVMSNVEVFAKQDELMDRWTDGRVDVTHYIDPHAKRSHTQKSHQKWWTPEI